MSITTFLKIAAIALALITAALRLRPDSGASKLLLRQVGPRTDTENMTRSELLRSAGSFLKFALLAGVIAAISFWSLGEDSPDAEFVSFGLVGSLCALAAVVALVGGLWLGARGLLEKSTAETGGHDPSAPIEPS